MAPRTPNASDYPNSARPCDQERRVLAGRSAKGEHDVKRRSLSNLLSCIVVYNGPLVLDNVILFRQGDICSCHVLSLLVVFSQCVCRFVLVARD